MIRTALITPGGRCLRNPGPGHMGKGLVTPSNRPKIAMTRYFFNANTTHTFPSRALKILRRVGQEFLSGLSYGHSDCRWPAMHMIPRGRGLEFSTLDSSLRQYLEVNSQLLEIVALLCSLNIYQHLAPADAFMVVLKSP